MRYDVQCDRVGEILQEEWKGCEKVVKTKNNTLVTEE